MYAERNYPIVLELEEREREAGVYMSRILKPEKATLKSWKPQKRGRKKKKRQAELLWDNVKYDDGKTHGLPTTTTQRDWFKFDIGTTYFSFPTVLYTPTRDFWIEARK